MTEEAMSARNTILDKLRRNRVPREDDYELPPVKILGDLDKSIERFEKSLQLMGGEVLPQRDGQTIEDVVRARFPNTTSICSAVPEVEGTLKITDLKTHEQSNEVDVMVVRSPFGIAEMGSIFLSEVELFDHLADVHLAQHLVVLLSREELTANMHTAYRERSEFKTAFYGVLMSGPSATADIQGVLIRGAQGVRTLSLIWTS